MKYELVIARANTYIAFSPRVVDFFTGALQVVKFEHSVCYFVIIDRVHDHKTKLYLKNANKTLNLHFQGKEIAKLGLLWGSIFSWEENWREIDTTTTVLAHFGNR